MTRRAILHIGTEKTGTTALQMAFRREAERLAALGVRYPDFRMLNHAALAFAAADAEAGVQDLGPHIGLLPGETRADFVARLHGWLDSETRAHPDGRFVFSTEHAQSRLNSVAAVERVRAILSEHFDGIEIAVYLRRWDRMALSYHATAVRNGTTARFTFNRYAKSPLLDYPGLLDRWAQVFGAEHVHVRVFDRVELTNGSILDDFTARFNLPPLSRVDDQNVAIDAAGQDLLRLLDRALEERTALDRAAVREAVVAAIRPDPHVTPPVTRAEAQQFVANFANDEIALRKRWFPERTALFDDRFDDYSEAVTLSRRNWRDLSAVLVDALLASADRENGARAESRYYRTLAHHRAGRLALAETEIREAIALRPGVAGYWLVLAELLQALERPADARGAIEAALAIEPHNDDFRRRAASLCT